MNWVFYNLIMFIASVGLYLAVRLASIRGVKSSFSNLAMFLVPLCIFLVIALKDPSQLHISTVHLLMIIGIAVFFAFTGNTTSLRAIERAPNPGYSLVLSKTYVVFTTIVALTIFGEEFNVRKLIAIGLIVVFAGSIMLSGSSSNENSDKGDRSWIALSLYSFFAWGMLSLSSKYLFSHGVSTMAFLVYLYLIVTLCIGIAFWRQLKFRELQRSSWMLFLVIGIASAAFNLGQFEAIRLAPNVGYVNAINAGSIATVTLLAARLFNDDINRTKLIGVGGVTLGLVLLLI